MPICPKVSLRNRRALTCRCRGLGSRCPTLFSQSCSSYPLALLPSPTVGQFASQGDLTLTLLLCLFAPATAGVVQTPPAPSDPTVENCEAPPPCPPGETCGEGETYGAQYDPLADLFGDCAMWALTH
jgi:hypothetical protein